MMNIIVQINLVPSLLTSFMMQQASITIFTARGGFFIAFTSVMSDFVRVSSAERAASSIGIA